MSVPLIELRGNEKSGYSVWARQDETNAEAPMLCYYYDCGNVGIAFERARQTARLLQIPPVLPLPRAEHDVPFTLRMNLASPGATCDV